MYFIISAKDKAGALALRMATRQAHFDYAQARGGVRLGGPYLDAAGDMIGSLIVLEAADLAAAQDWAANDPYNKAGVFESVAVTPWKPTLNACEARL